MFLAVFPLFFLFISLVKSEPRKPYWNDYQTSFFIHLDEYIRPGWKVVGDMFYMGSAEKMRIDYWNFCEPHLNFTTNMFDCSYIFTEGYVFFYTENGPNGKQCCIWNKMNPLAPGFLQNAVYEGSEVVQGTLCNKWEVQGIPEPGFRYWADYNSYKPIMFQGSNQFLGRGEFYWLFYDESTPINSTKFVVDSSCYYDC